MEERRSPAAAQSAAVLGSRNSRRQLRAVLAAAAEAGAYSVGFCVARGGLTGFSVYFAGDFAGAGKRASSGAAAYYCAAPHSSRGDSTTASAQPTTARAPAASAAPAQPAAARRRGCRAGAKQQQRRHGACGRSTAATTAAVHAAPLEGGMRASRPRGDATNDASAPLVPPPHANEHSPSAQPPSSLSPLAPAFAPPASSAPPLCPSPSLASSGEEAPRSIEPNLHHLLPHPRLSYEEQRWEYYRSCGGPFPSHGSSKKRQEPPSPPWPAPSAVVGCVVNERRTRAAPPPPPSTPRLPPSRKR